MTDYAIYETTLQTIKNYFNQEEKAEYLFLHGGCYWLAKFLTERIQGSYLMFNKEKEHCAVEFEHRLYDITGPIKNKQYVLATKRNEDYMKKHYPIEFDEKALKNAIDQQLKQNNLLIHKFTKK